MKVEDSQPKSSPCFDETNTNATVTIKKTLTDVKRKRSLNAYKRRRVAAKLKRKSNKKETNATHN